MSFAQAESLTTGLRFQTPCTVIAIHEPEVIGTKVYRRVVLRSRDEQRVTTLRIAAGPLVDQAFFALRHRSTAGEGIAAARAAELGLPMDLLSRLDVVVWLDGDADPLDSAIEMAEREAIAAEARQPTDKPEVRQMKLLAAFLRDRFPVVDLTAVRPALGRAMADLGSLLREATDRVESGLDMDALVRRMSNSLRKLTGPRRACRGAGWRRRRTWRRRTTC